jgi:predicted NUDIX family NTP pyrophosphohydrolase
MFRRQDGGQFEVFLVHPGGPIWAKKDQGAWTVPKGEYGPKESPLDAARREFTEETGFPTNGPFIEIGSVRQRSGKNTTVWAFEGDCDPNALKSNTCKIEWPPRSARKIDIVEVDRGRWFSLQEAHEYVREEQREFLRRLSESVGQNPLSRTAK